jgi:modulator of FtsH protease
VAQDWGNFAVITGGAAGALTGLLFVAVSLNRDRIAGHPGLRSQAGQTLVLFMLPLLLAVLLALPGWSATTLGAGLIATAAVAGAALVLIGRENKPAAGHAGGGPAGGGREDRLARFIHKASPNLSAVVLVLVAGCLQCAGGSGLYWAAASGVLSLISGVVNAWLFLTRA